jgi:hypothetical protein
MVSAFGTLLLSYLGFALIALSQERHWEAVVMYRAAAAAGPARCTFVAGMGGVLAALGVALATQGPSFGALLWAVAISAAAVAVAFTLSWWPRALRPLGRLMLRPAPVAGDTGR